MINISVSAKIQSLARSRKCLCCISGTSGKARSSLSIVAFLGTKRAQNVIFHWKHRKNENRPSAEQFPKTSLAFCDRMNTARAYASSGKFSLTNCQ